MNPIPRFHGNASGCSWRESRGISLSGLYGNRLVGSSCPQAVRGFPWAQKLGGAEDTQRGPETQPHPTCAELGPLWESWGVGVGIGILQRSRSNEGSAWRHPP